MGGVGAQTIPLALGTVGGAGRSGFARAVETEVGRWLSVWHGGASSTMMEEGGRWMPLCVEGTGGAAGRKQSTIAGGTTT